MLVTFPYHLLRNPTPARHCFFEKMASAQAVPRPLHKVPPRLPFHEEIEETRRKIRASAPPPSAAPLREDGKCPKAASPN